MRENSLLIPHTEAKTLEKFHVDHRVTLTNASACFLLKNHFAKYFQDTHFKSSDSEKDQHKCMEKVYKLVCTFESLERLVAHSATADPAAARTQLTTAVNEWKEHFVSQLELLFSETNDARTTALVCKIKTDINQHTALFLNSIEQTSDFNIRQRYARHDLGTQMSLGHLIALNLDAVLSSGLKLSYHYSPHSIMNLWYVDRAIASLSNAKSELRLQNFSLEGRIKVSAIHPFDKSMMARLNPGDSPYEKYEYLAPENNPTAAERLLKIKASLEDNSSEDKLYASSYMQNFIKIVCSILDLIFLSLVALNVLNYIILNCANLLTLNHYEEPIIQLYQDCQTIFTKIYRYCSLLQRFQEDENARIKAHVYFDNKSDEEKNFFEASLVKKNYIQTLIDDLSFKPTATVSPTSLTDFKTKHLKFQKPDNLTETINHTEFNPRNEFSSPVEIMGELSILLNDGIESCFRSSPVVSTAGFCASLLTLFAYLNPALIIPGTKFLMIKLQQLIDMTNMAFCGEAAHAGLSQEILGIFLTWQLNGVFLDLPLWPLQERLGFAADYTHQMSVYITKFALLCGLSFTIGQLHPVNINWAKLSPFHWFNVVCQSFLGIASNFTNLIIEETNICANGAPILSYFSRVLFTLKGCLILKDWLSCNKPVEHERHRADNAEENPPTLQTYLYLLETGHQELLEASQQREFAIEFYLELKTAFDAYNNTNSTKIDADILLDAYFNLYCQSNYLNYCKLLIVPYILLTIAELLAGHLYYAMSSEPDKRALSEIYTIRARKNMEGMLLIGIQMIYYPLYMLDAFIRMIWNYLIVGVIRAPVTLIGATFAFFENYHNWKSTQSYILLCQIDDSIANFKIKHQLCQLLQPIYGLIADLARSTAVYHDLRGIATCLLTQISDPPPSEGQVAAMHG